MTAIRPVEHIRQYPPETLDRATLVLLRDDLVKTLKTSEEARSYLTAEQAAVWDRNFGQETKEQEDALAKIMAALREKAQ